LFLAWGLPAPFFSTYRITMNTVHAALKGIFGSIPRNAVSFHTYRLLKPNLNYQIIGVFVCLDKKTGYTRFVDKSCTKAQARELKDRELLGPFGWSLK
jgi:N-acetylmuramoyl-L-alanine amidase CwlA